MRILVLGAGGFIGSRLVASLLPRKHSVICAGRSIEALHRRFPSCTVIKADLLLDRTSDWVPRLAGVDVVVNTAGVLRGDLQRVHHLGAAALFDACAMAGVPRVLQVSALGAGAQPDSRFLTTKYEADMHVLRLAESCEGRQWCVLRPSLVIGRGGASTALFSAMAAASPVPLTIGSGIGLVQPIHIADLTRAIADLIEAPSLPPQLNLVGPTEMTISELIEALRDWLGLRPVRAVALPLTLLRLAARLGDILPEASLTCESLRMLAAGNTADVAPLASSLGWRPRMLANALAAEPSVKADLWHARLLPLRWFLLAALLVVWVGSGIVSFTISPERASSLLSGLRLGGSSVVAVTWAGAGLDVVLGLALLFRRWRRSALLIQLAVMIIYTVLASALLPALWGDPFGPLLKNFAVIAVTLVLATIED
jgi:nucleoside-diphosphate-sugar epimerase